MNRENVITKIRDAFLGVKLGKGISIREADILDRYAQGEDMKLARSLDVVDSWEDIPDDLLESLSVLSHMDEEGVRYYLPAYMVWTLKNWDKSDSLVTEATVNYFLSASAVERCRLLNFAQKQAVVEFFEHSLMERDDLYISDKDAKKAIARIRALE